MRNGGTGVALDPLFVACGAAQIFPIVDRGNSLCRMDKMFGMANDVSSPASRSGNGIILNRSIPFDRRIDAVLELWQSEDRRDDVLVNDMAFFVLYCWFGTAKQRGWPPIVESPQLRAYIDASLHAIGGQDGWNSMLFQREYCYCGQTNKLHNIGICVDCLLYECWECSGEHAKQTGHDVVG